MIRMPDPLMKRYLEQYDDKCAIAYHVVGRLDPRDKVYVDTGTTPAHIFDQLSQADKDLCITTHSAFALTNVGARNELVLIGGRLDNRYGGLYPESREQCYEILKPLKIKKIILAVAAITYHDGPLVEAGDRSNQIFKEALIRKCLDNRAITLLVVADWTKFISHKERKSRQEVLRPGEWVEVRRRSDYVLITKFPDDTVPASAAASSRRMIERFQKSERNRGMQVVALT